MDAPVPGTLLPAGAETSRRGRLDPDERATAGLDRDMNQAGFGKVDLQGQSVAEGGASLLHCNRVFSI